MHKPGGPIDRCVRIPLEETAAIAAGTGPVDTGFMLNDRTIEVVAGIGSAHGVLTYHAPYTQFVLRGTGIYGPSGTPIVPKTAQYLVFRGRDGGLVYAKEVRGQHAQPFLQEAFKVASPWPVRFHS
jgi:hypothetical protein